VVGSYVGKMVEEERGMYRRTRVDRDTERRGATEVTGGGANARRGAQRVEERGKRGSRGKRKRRVLKDTHERRALLRL